ncbi:MAG: 7-cyano-7-deazaguanine synthase QueC [Elusimicrobiota bacterium]|nr:7-cyano-7-deazaguanine synthase QueC [Elusimicrobiota bacterium]
MKGKKAVVLFSGGLDSTTALCWALSKGYECLAVSFDYGQRHSRENAAARAIALRLGVKLYGIKLDFPWFRTSSLVNGSMKLPDIKLSEIGRKGAIPSTYVPGRNLVFASAGFSLADAEGAGAVVLGPNAVDYSGYPDCRPEFYRALEKAAAHGTRPGPGGKGIKLLTPLIKLSKADIVRLAVKLKAPLELTWSCYRGGRSPCGRCDSCKLRAKGFAEAGLKDPAPGRSGK